MVLDALKWALWAIALLGLWTLVGFAVYLLICPVLARRSREQARAMWNWEGERKDER